MPAPLPLAIAASAGVVARHDATTIIGATLAILLGISLLCTLAFWACCAVGARSEPSDDDDACWSGWPVCPLCDDSGFAETYHGGIWTGENVSSSQSICDCPCGEDVRRELASRHAQPPSPRAGEGRK